jgi:hypothetical protein
MLMECLAAGRGICLPATANASSKVSTAAMFLYTKHRKQFNIPLINMEAIENKLANMLYNTWAIQASIFVTNQLLDAGEKPAVISAIMKHQTTERGREVIKDAMDIYGGSGICKGDNNMLEKFYKNVPIGITVEGSNVLTKNLIIFGQGLNKSHPYIYPIVKSIDENDKNAFYIHFKNIVQHSVGLVFKALNKSIFSNNLLETQTVYFACLSNFVALKGGKLKKEQNISGDMAQIMGNLYMAHCVKIYEEHMQINKTLCDLVIEKILNENIEIINRVVHNLDYSVFLCFMTKIKKENYKTNSKIINELKNDVKIKNELLNSIYLDKAMTNLITLDKLDKSSEKYKELYQKVISVGEYKI